MMDNWHIGQRIWTLQQLAKAAKAKRSVVSLTQGALLQPKPAAFVLNWQGFRIWQTINSGLFIYKRGPSGFWNKVTPIEQVDEDE